MKHLRKPLLILFSAVCLTASAQFGVFNPSESFNYIDQGTGKTVTVLTDTTRNDRFLYQTDPMFTADGRYIVFRSSSRSNADEIVSKDGKHRYKPTFYYFIELESGKIIQATDDSSISNIYLGNRSNKLFYNKRDKDGGWKMYVMDLDRFFTDAKAGNVWLIDVATGHRYLMASDAKMTPDHAQPFFSPDGKYMFYQSGHFTNGKRLNLMKIKID